MPSEDANSTGYDDPFGKIDLEVLQHPSLTHLDTYDVVHNIWDKFTKDMTSALVTIFPTQPRKYMEVQALLLNWEEDDLGTNRNYTTYPSSLSVNSTSRLKFGKFQASKPKTSLRRNQCQDAVR